MHVETTLRQALAARGVSLRSAEAIPHVNLPGYWALVCECEGKGKRFDVFTRLDLRTEDWRWWVKSHCGSCIPQATDGATVAAGDQVRAVGDRVEC